MAEKLACPKCGTTQINIRNENCKCLKCGEVFSKNNAKIIKARYRKNLPPLLRKITLAKKGIVVDALACPFCGSLSVTGVGKSKEDNKAYCMCNHCKQKVERKYLIKYGSKPVMKINSKREVL